MDLTASNQIREALPGIIREFQRSVPKPESSHWQTQSVFVQFVSIDMTNAGRQSGAPTFKAHFKIVSQNDKTLWIFFNRKRSQLESLIKDVIKQQNKGRCIKCGHTNRVEAKFCGDCGSALDAIIKEIQFRKGSLEVIVIFQLLISVIGVYPQIKEFTNDLNGIISELSKAFAGFFQSYPSSVPLGSAAPPIALSPVPPISIGTAIASPSGSPKPVVPPTTKKSSSIVTLVLLCIIGLAIANSSSGQATITSVSADHNVGQGGMNGMLIHVNFSVDHLKGEKISIVAYFYRENGDVLRDTNNKYRSIDGQVSVGKEVTPADEQTRYDDEQLFMPISELDLGNCTCQLKFKVELSTSSRTLQTSEFVHFQHDSG